jgi:hypothetical protein
MITLRNLFFGAAVCSAFSLGMAEPGFAQSLSLRSVVKWPLHDRLGTAVGGGVQLRTAGKFILDIQGAGGTELRSPCGGGLIPPGTDCSPVERDFTFMSLLVGYPAASLSSGKWTLDSVFLGGLSGAMGLHLTGALGIEGSRRLAGSLRIGAQTRAALLFPPFNFERECVDCFQRSDDMIPVFDFGLLISF